MPQEHQSYSFIPPTYVTPIACPVCGANAHLIRRTPLTEGKGESRTFECKDCLKLIDMTVID